MKKFNRSNCEKTQQTKIMREIKRKQNCDKTQKLKW